MYPKLKAIIAAAVAGLALTLAASGTAHAIRPKPYPVCSADGAAEVYCYAPANTPGPIVYWSFNNVRLYTSSWQVTYPCTPNQLVWVHFYYLDPESPTVPWHSGDTSVYCYS